MVHRAPLVFALFSLTVIGLPAQSNGGTTAESSKRSRSISPEVAAALAAGMPKYDPPKAVAPKDEEDLPDMRDVDKPRNQIIRLPDYVVREKRPPVFRERDINTTKGLSAVAMKRYFSETAKALNRYTIPLFGMSQEAYANMPFAEDGPLENIASLKSTAADLKALGGDGTSISREVDRTYIRRSDYGYQKQK